MSSEGRSLEEVELLAKRIRGADIAYGIPTSGTTGKPKIALNTQEGLACRLEWMTALSGEGGRYLQKAAKTILECHRAKECDDMCMSIKDIITLIPEEIE